MNLGELIKWLEGRDPNDVAKPGLTHPHSYRGHYDQLAFAASEQATAGEMLAIARGAVGETFAGYKGGDFTMSEYTDVWLASYGETGEMITPLSLQAMFGQDNSTKQETRDFRAALLANLRHIGATLEDTYLVQTGWHGGPFLNEINKTGDDAVKSTNAYIEKWGSKDAE